MSHTYRNFEPRCFTVGSTSSLGGKFEPIKDFPSEKEAQEEINILNEGNFKSIEILNELNFIKAEVDEVKKLILNLEKTIKRKLK